MTDQSDWDDWAKQWTGSHLVIGAVEVRAQVGRNAARSRRARSLETVVALLGAGGVLAALVHAHDVPDIINAVITVAGIAVILFWRMHRESAVGAAFAASTHDFIEQWSGVCRAELRAIRFAWTVIALDLVFLIPWWAGGLAAHNAELDSSAVLALWWLPIGVIIALTTWTLFTYARLRAELHRLDSLRAKYRAAS